MRELRNRVVTTKLPDGRIFAAGNLFTKTAEIYDPGAGAWAFTADLLVNRHLFTMTAFPNGVVLIVGGITGSGDYHDSCELYLPPAP